MSKRAFPVHLTKNTVKKQLPVPILFKCKFLKTEDSLSGGSFPNVWA